MNAPPSVATAAVTVPSSIVAPCRSFGSEAYASIMPDTVCTTSRITSFADDPVSISAAADELLALMNTHLAEIGTSMPPVSSQMGATS